MVYLVLQEQLKPRAYSYHTHQLQQRPLNSLIILGLFRFIHGAVSSAINPLAFSLVSDYFPPEKRTTANSILGGANFVGIALSSMTILLIQQVGWRASYIAMGGMGLIAGSMLMLLKHPVLYFSPINFIKFSRIGINTLTSEIRLPAKTDTKALFFPTN